MKKILLIPALIIALLIGQVASAAFSDVDDGTSYESSIEWMNNNGVIQGYPDGTFKPDQCVNRAEFLKMMYLTVETDIVVEDGFAGSNYYDDFFTDTYTDQWYWPYVEQALRDEAIEGYPDGTFKPEQCVNRAEAIKMGVLGFDMLNEDSVNRGANIYRDVVPGFNWFDVYLYSAVDANAVGKDHVTSVAADSMPELYFAPGESMSRKEVAEMLYRMKTLTDNEVFGYVETMSPDNLNYYISPSSGVSFLMPDGWEVIGEVAADYPTILFDGPSEEEDELITVSINQTTMNCGTEVFSATCFDLNENYTIGAYDPDLYAMQLMNRIMLTFREPEEPPFHYSNPEFNLYFDFPADWAVTSQETVDVLDHTKLIINLATLQNPDVGIMIATPPVERGMEGMTVEAGFPREIEGLTQNVADLFRSENTDWLTALNTYYIDESDWISNIEFDYFGPGDVFDTYLPDYLFILESAEFSNRGEVAFDGCGVPSEYASEDWWVDFVGTWDAYALTLPGDFPLHDALQDDHGDYCLALDESMFIFIPAYYEGGVMRVFNYDIINDIVNKAESDGPYAPREFGVRNGDYIPLIGIHDYYGCEYIAGNYYYLENRIEVTEDTCTN
ncbi:S-layer homology domain-containing protein [Patescibacteria group bacterium]